MSSKRKKQYHWKGAFWKFQIGPAMSPIVTPYGLQLGPKLLSNGSKLRPSCAQIVPSWGQVWPKLEPSGSKLGRSWSLMLRPFWIETVHLHDFVPICKMRKLPRYRALFGDLDGNEPPSWNYILYTSLTQICPVAPTSKFSRLGTHCSEKRFYPNSVSTLRGSYGRNKSRCSIRVLTLGRVPVNFCVKWLLWNFDMRCDCEGSRQVCSAVLVCGILRVNFPRKWLLWSLDMRFDCAGSHKVWVRVLGPIWAVARTKCVWPRSGPNLGRGIFPVNFHGSSDVSCDMWTCISIAQVCTKCVSAFWAQSGPNLGRGIFPVNLCIKWLFWWLLWHVDVHFDAQARTKCVCPRSGPNLGRDNFQHHPFSSSSSS